MKKNFFSQSIIIFLFFCYFFALTYAATEPSADSQSTAPVYSTDDWYKILNTTKKAADKTNLEPWMEEWIEQQADQSINQIEAIISANKTQVPTEVIVTEKIPGMDCKEILGGGPETKKYKCVVKPGFGSVMLIFKGLIKYTTFLVALIAVLMLVVSGIQYSISGADESQAKNAKERIKKVLMGIVLLFLIGFILNSVAPWIYR